MSVRRGKASFFSGCDSHLATVAPASSNRSGSGGNDTAEAFDAKGRIGDPASRQAITRVNAEQASKRFYCGSRPSGHLGKAAVVEIRGATRSLRRSRRGTGVVAMACLHKENARNTGDPSGGRTACQRDAREGQARPCGESDRPIVPSRPGNAGGGKGPDFGRVPEAVTIRRVAMLPSTKGR